MGRKSVNFIEEKVIYRGAEATISLGTWHDLTVVRKWRRPKTYRIEALDQALRGKRTSQEAQLLHGSRKAGVPTPTVLLMSIKEATLLLSYIEGERLRDKLISRPSPDMVPLCSQVGRMVGRLHGVGIIHGDLTTSNMIVTDDNRIFLIDFGLGSYSWEEEDMGVDLLLMRRVLESTHFRVSAECFHAFIDGYKAELGQKAEGNLRKITEIERRARYVDRSLRR